jgi:hypothetical protein
MKRPPPDAERPHGSSKRPRPPDEDNLFADGSQRDPHDICVNGTDGTGYISVAVFMTFAVRNNKARFNVRSHTLTIPNTTYRFDLEFSGPWVSLLEPKLVFETNTRLDVSLKGVQMVPLKGSSGPGSLSMALKWTEGVVFAHAQMVNGVFVREVVDAWKRKLLYAHGTLTPHACAFFSHS